LTIFIVAAIARSRFKPDFRDEFFKLVRWFVPARIAAAGSFAIQDSLLNYRKRGELAAFPSFD